MSRTAMTRGWIRGNCHRVPAENAACAAGYIERHQDVVADFEIFHVFAELLHHAGEPVAERHPHSGIRDEPVV